MPAPRKTSGRAPVKSVSPQLVSSIYLPSEHQPQLALFPIAEVERDGVAMGVLSDGTPYLHLRGLARLCGVDHSVVQRLISNWPEEKAKPRGLRLQELLAAQGYKSDALFLRTIGANGETLAITDAVCMAILEYYAFEATQSSSGVALRNYRILARTSFRTFIYQGCGYVPDAHVPDSWRTFHERILLNDQIPIGFFSIFREIADLVVHMIKAGCNLDSHTVPDGSVGIRWSTHWVRAGFAGMYGERQKMGHKYPNSFPQSVANPVPAWVYPVEALGEFRKWLYAVYVPENFPDYIKSKVKQGMFLPAHGQALLSAVQRPALPAA